MKPVRSSVIPKSPADRILSRHTQYWKKPHGTARDDLHVAVNARYTYWQTRRPIPGGVAFENFELRERFYEGQVFVFGITRKTPPQLRTAQ